eukprot:4094373-Prymnesium_polylepis.1
MLVLQSRASFGQREAQTHFVRRLSERAPMSRRRGASNAQDAASLQQVGKGRQLGTATEPPSRAAR